LMRVDYSTGKGTSGMGKFSSEVHRVHMELEGKLLNSLRIKTQYLERLQSVSVVDGAAHTQKDDVESNEWRLLGDGCKGLCAVPLRRSAGSEVWCPHVLDLDDSLLLTIGICHAPPECIFVPFPHQPRRAFSPVEHR